MQDSEKLCLKWNDFQENLNSAFGVLRNAKELSDVTLACEDGTQVETHKVILASSSPFFMEIFKKNKHPHPLIYMRGIKADLLVAMVDFLYCGEANVGQTNLDAFLGLAEELRLKGLIPSDQVQMDSPETKQPKYQPHEETQHQNFLARKQWGTESDLPFFTDVQHPQKEKVVSSEMSVALVSEDVQQLDEQIKSLMDFSENMLTNGNKRERGRICKVCGKEGFLANIKTHIEANHITSNISHSCNICGKISRSRHGLRLHKAEKHNA